MSRLPDVSRRLVLSLALPMGAVALIAPSLSKLGCIGLPQFELFSV